MKPARTKNLSALALLVLFWLYVSIPLAWGTWSTLQKALALFN